MALTAAPIPSFGDAELETHGGALVNLLGASGAIADCARQLMAAEGLHSGMPGERPAVADWFPLTKNLRILFSIGQILGSDALFEIGLAVPRSAAFPPGIDDLPHALERLDVAFHMNHRRGGVPMYDPRSETMLEGIGHYRFRRVDGRTTITESTSVYPCEFDHGVLAGLSARFDARTSVVHSPRDPCRRRGAEACSYLVAC
jgi:hypothetical protein